MIEAGFLIIEVAPGGSPVDNPDEINEMGEGYEVPYSGFLIL